MSHYPSRKPNWPLVAPVIALLLWGLAAFMGTPLWLSILCAKPQEQQGLCLFTAGRTCDWMRHFSDLGIPQ